MAGATNTRSKVRESTTTKARWDQDTQTGVWRRAEKIDAQKADKLMQERLEQGSKRLS